MGRLMEDDYSGSDEDYIEYSDEDTTKDIDVRRAYDRSPTPYQEREPRTPPRGYPNARDSLIPIKIEEDGTRVYNTRGIHVGNHFMIDSPQLPVKHRTQSRENKTYGTHHFADALTSIGTEDPQGTKEWLEKILKGYQDKGTQTDNASLKPGFKKDCENALVAINNILKTEDD